MPNTTKKRIVLYACLLLLATIASFPQNRLLAAQDEAPQTTLKESTIYIAVLDPLAVQLACKCVDGFAQRDYIKLADYLETKLGRKVQCVFASSISAARIEIRGPVHLIIGKDSIVRFDAGEWVPPIKLSPIAALTDPKGQTTFTGLFIVREDSPAKKIEDLAGYQIFFGPTEAVEKSTAAVDALRKAKINLPETLTRSANCTEAAFAVLEADEEVSTAAVISSYAFRLLEGCNTIEPDSLRVIGQTDPVPFIRVFTTDALDEPTTEKVTQALLSVADHPELLKAIESKNGFIKIRAKLKSKNVKSAPTEESPTKNPLSLSTPKTTQQKFPLHTGWPQWRGPHRDAHVKSLPKKLPDHLKSVWEVPLNSPGLAGIAADEHYVIIADRDATDQNDRFLCLDATSGKTLWEFSYFASAEMDYGCAPRATPLLIGDLAILLGAMGDLHAVRLSDGEVVWKKSFPLDFDAIRPTWGWSGSPILLDNKIILQPGGEDASIVALDPATGQTVWKTSGQPTAYASMIVGTFGGVRQLVGFDETSLGGWDIKTGRRLWQLIPPEEGDFNVPTPIALDGQLLVTTENNGTRLYRFADDGTIEKEPIAQNFDLAPDTSTAVVSAGRVFGVYDSILCLDLHQENLKTIASLDADGCDSYASLIASDDRLLIVTMSGSLILIDTTSKEPQILSEVTLFDDPGESYSHPALVGSRLYLRNGHAVHCVELNP